MSLGTIISIITSGGCLVMVLVNRLLSRQLKETERNLEKAQLEIINKNNELEVIKSVQSELKTSNNRKGPKKTEPADEGDSSSRISRLNGVSDHHSKN